jgi:hypothetical protein
MSLQADIRYNCSVDARTSSSHSHQKGFSFGAVISLCNNGTGVTRKDKDKAIKIYGKVKVKQSRYMPWRRLGGEEV